MTQALSSSRENPRKAGKVASRPLTRPGRALKWTGLSVASCGLQLLVVALLLPWHSIMYEDRLYSQQIEFLETHPWGAHLEDPETDCDDYLFYGFGGTNCAGDESESEVDPDFERRTARAETVLHRGLLLLGGGLLVTQGALLASAFSPNRRLMAPILLMVGAGLLLAAATTYLVGESMLADAFEKNFELQGSDLPLYKVENDTRIGTTLGFIAIPLILLGGLLDFAGRRNRAPSTQQAPSISSTPDWHSSPCSRCGSPFRRQVGGRSSCVSCGNLA